MYAAVNRFRVDDLQPYICRTHDGGETWKRCAGSAEDGPVNTVREDPVRKGLLFAGTERTVYFSASTMAITGNLCDSTCRPRRFATWWFTSDDVVVGTHGRCFWILDNVTPLRQLTDPAIASAAYLFAPQVTYRIRRNNSTDTPLPPEISAGQNPPDGAMIDYWLKSASSDEVSLEIVDSSGKLVRRFSSVDKSDAPDPKGLNCRHTGFVLNERFRLLAGMHRFVWDLH